MTAATVTHAAVPEVSLRTGLLLGGAALLFLALLSAATLLLAVHPPRYRSSLTPAAYGWPYEAVALRTGDGLTLAAWYIPAEAGHGEEAVIVLHGYPFDKGNVLPVTPFLHQRYDLLLFDFRSFGGSQGHASTLGVREELDLLAALAYLKEQRGKTRIGLYGFSLGAAVALQTAAKAPQVKAVVADSPYASLEQMALDTYRSFGALQHPLTWLTLALARLYPGVDPSQATPAQAVRRWDGPVLLVHGGADTQIGVHHAYALREAMEHNPRAHVWLVAGADHGQAWARHQGEYEARVLAFLREHLVW